MRVTFLRPLDQFLGTDRLLTRLQTFLRQPDLQRFRLQVSFAKSGPLLRLARDIDNWRRAGKSIEAIFGIDHTGTSKQALEFALARFNQTYITATRANSTFHPKFYLFDGRNSAVCIYGSHNLTVGGTETNLEGGVQIDFTRPGDDADFQQALEVWNSLLPANCPLTRQLDAAYLADLLREGKLCDDTSPRQPTGGSTSGGAGAASSSVIPYIPPKPPSALPPSAFAQGHGTGAVGRAHKAKKVPAARAVPGVQTLVIQVVPHHNGEIFLSKMAVNQNPQFFGYPFAGSTVPKKAGNPSYPQRTPDPVVDITVFDRRGRIAFTRQTYRLNTVYYEKKAEIRITVSPDILAHIPEFSVMVMRQASGAHDYDIEIYQPGSGLYASYLAVCNQTLPSGGAAHARKMGWS